MCISLGEVETDQTREDPDAIVFINHDSERNPFATQPTPLHQAKFTVWCWFTASFIIVSYFFEETGDFGPVTAIATVQRYERLLRNHVIPDLQQLGCGDGIIFMPDGASPYISNPVKQQLNRHFGNASVTIHYFPTSWPPVSSDLNLCDFLLWDY
ncbi:uncharacterized protein TNCV_2146571 [Trichonephila clavipes]|uniref:Transposase n=1 Tax=Trichonephila clavipes TaxID=2585209 RepID=A0A8X6STY3_TRICX|nr:uncharacterized protein TNCV_2146571 [Trichonephila clavipes]